MLRSVSLDGNWKIRGFDGQHGLPETYCRENTDDSRWLDAVVPGEVHLDLQNNGIIADCNIGTNALSARWVEEEIWVYRRSFEAPDEAVDAFSWLTFDGLDLNADIYLNDELIGNHSNFFIPCKLPVKGKLRCGTNTIAVRLDSGLYEASEKPFSGYTNNLADSITKRIWQRKPQYTFSWDWSPRLVNVGIWGSARLEWTSSVRIDSASIMTVLNDDHKTAQVICRVFIENPSSQTINVAIGTRMPQIDAQIMQQVQAEPGISRHEVVLDVENPKLWWPRPHGEQFLYDVQISVEVDGNLVQELNRRIGIRSVRINRDKHPVDGSYFTLEVNGVPIFAKGGNWVPPDIICSKIDNSRVQKLIELATQANFNMLRVWGGGLYADNDMLNICDKLGIMVWHDLPFACAQYPGDDHVFKQNVLNEVRHHIRDKSGHPSLVVWCGNNEIEWTYQMDEFQQKRPLSDYALYHREFPRISAEEDASTPYWPGSPFSEDSCEPNDHNCGDQHPWDVTLWADGPNFWAYRRLECRFPNEGGVLGASSPATICDFLDGEKPELRSRTWDFHDNACNWVSEDIVYRMCKHWLNRDPMEMAPDDYLFYSGILQAEGLREYIDNFRRRMFDSSSAIFWMYNDSWPATHGWSIVDYYLRRKLAYHPVRRSFANVHTVLAIVDDNVIIYGINDTLKPCECTLDCGLFLLHGGLPVHHNKPVELPGNSVSKIGAIPIAEWESLGTDKSGAFAVLQRDGINIAQNQLFVKPFHALKFVRPTITVERHNNCAVFHSDVFVWAACLDVNGEQPLADDVFDLIPGIAYHVALPDGGPLPEIVRHANLL